MKLQPRHFVFAALAVLLMVAAASAFTKKERAGVEEIPFGILANNPNVFNGRMVMYGGNIIAVHNLKDSTEIEVLQLPVTRRGKPIDTDESEGRFIITVIGYLDPYVYQHGKYISVIGVVRGADMRFINGVPYRYPVLDGIQLKLWKPEELAPKVRFGVGLGLGVPLYR